MALNPWEFSYNGLIFGGDTSYGLIKIQGLGIPDSREETVDKVEQHGSYVFAGYLDARRIIIQADISPRHGEDFEALVNTWRRTFGPQLVDLPLDFLIPGDGDQVKRVMCVPSKRSLDIDTNYTLGYAEWAVEFLAGDPTIYAGDPSGGGGNPGGGTGTAGEESITVVPGIQLGLDFGGPGSGLDFGGPGGGLDFGGGGAGTAVANNVGTADAYGVATIYGPVETPTLRNVTTGKQLTLVTDEIVAGQFMVIDFKNRTVMLGGTSSRYSTVEAGSEFWALVPGSNTIQFSGANTTAETYAKFTWRPAWV